MGYLLGEAWHALSDLKDNGLINFSELDQLKNLDAKKQLSIARLIAEENKFSLDLTKKIKGIPEDKGIYKTLNDIGCACVTTNHDHNAPYLSGKQPFDRIPNAIQPYRG